MSVHLIVVDTETGGLEPSEHCIIELAARHAIIQSDCTVLSTSTTFHAYVLPGRPVHPQAPEVNGYPPELWREREARSMFDVGRSFLAWLAAIPHEDLTWAGSNVSGFDLPFLRSDLKRVGMELPGKPKFGRRNLNTESLCFPLLVRAEVDSCGIHDGRRRCHSHHRNLLHSSCSTGPSSLGRTGRRRGNRRTCCQSGSERTGDTWRRPGAQ